MQDSGRALHPIPHNRGKDPTIPNKFDVVRPEKFQFLEKWQNRNFDYKIVISVKNP